MAMMHSRNLEVFKKAYAAALDIHKVTDGFPKIELYGGIADQMRRASKGICANIVEGLEKQGTLIEQRRFLGLSLGSSEEMRVWCMFCRDLGYIPPQLYEKWDGEYEGISKMLSSLMKRRVDKNQWILTEKARKQEYAD